MVLYNLNFDTVNPPYKCHNPIINIIGTSIIILPTMILYNLNFDTVNPPYKCHNPIVNIHLAEIPEIMNSKQSLSSLLNPVYVQIATRKIIFVASTVTIK